MSDHLLVVRINAHKFVTLNCLIYVFSRLLVGFISIRVKQSPHNFGED